MENLKVFDYCNPLLATLGLKIFQIMQLVDNVRFSSLIYGKAKKLIREESILKGGFLNNVT